MRKRNQFGETVEGYSIPLLNEREIRVGLGVIPSLDYKKQFHSI